MKWCMPDEISNSGLLKFITKELVIGVLWGSFVAGGIAVSLNTNISRAQDTATDATRVGVANQEKLNKIEQDVAVIKVRQGNAAEAAKQQSEELREQRKDIQKILYLLGNGSESQRRVYDSE
jgi:hypothetical protein